MSNEVREGNSKQCSLHHHLHRLVFCFINLILHGGIKTTHFLNLGQVFGIFAGGQHGFQKGISAHDLVAVLKFLIIQIGEHGTSHGQLAKFDADAEYLDEDMDFTFEDFEMPETFSLLAGMQ